MQTWNQNGNWQSKEINLTEEWKKYFEKNSIDISTGIKNLLLDASKEKSFYVEFMNLVGLTLQMRNSITGTDVDYLISPILNSRGEFYCSNNYSGNDAPLPVDADANGAYNIARKGLMIINRIKESEKPDMSIKNADWLAFAQESNL